MNEYYQAVIDFFGIEWFEKGWKEFRGSRIRYSPDSLRKEVGYLELELHPLLKHVFKYQDRTTDELHFAKIPTDSAANFVFSHLGRDLLLLKKEINQTGDKIKKDLMNPKNFESHRFNLLVAAGWRLLGFEVIFIPSSSSLGKTADLCVTKGEFQYYIENKQANQHQSDLERYQYLCELVEKFFPILRARKHSDQFINIECFGNIEYLKKWIEKSISRKIWRDKTPPFGKKLKITFTPVSTKPAMLEILEAGGHFQKAPVFTRAEDSFFASDPVMKNVIYLNKNAVEGLPERISRLLIDANKKDKKNKKLLVYFDIGIGLSEWTTKISDEIMDGSIGEFENIDGFVVCQTQIQYIPNGSQMGIRIQPRFNLLGSVDKLGGTPESLEIFGYQGHTGMDGYLLPEYLNPI